MPGRVMQQKPAPMHAGRNGSQAARKATPKNVPRELGIYYDSGRTGFWGQNDRGRWILITASDVRRWLAEAGYDGKRPKRGASEVDLALNLIQRTRDVDYADNLAGYARGVYEISGNRVLVKDSPNLITPAQGSWETLQGIIMRMLGANQAAYFLGWLSVAVTSLYSGKFRVGQALALAGPRDCGKSLLQNLITELFGGRSAKCHRYMSGQTPFNGELFGAEHLMIEDEEASVDIRARRNFGAKIKEITANTSHTCHAKYRQAITLSPFWRLTISVNHEPENLMILPPIDESLQDKIILLKATRHVMPMPTRTHEERAAFMRALRGELPCLVDFLMRYDIPENMRSQRYGVAHFHHPDILQSLGNLAPETKLLEMIDTELFGSPAAGEWQGTANELERHLTRKASQVAREARQLFSFPTACGTYLGRLQEIDPERFEHDHTRAGNGWVIYPV